MTHPPTRDASNEVGVRKLQELYVQVTAGFVIIRSCDPQLFVDGDDGGGLEAETKSGSAALPGFCF